MNTIAKFGLMLAAIVIAVQVAWAAEPINYYNNALGKSDEALMTALRNIIRTHKEVSYGNGLLNAFAIADTDDKGYIIDIYSNCRYRPNDNGSSASHVGEGYNREHSFPRSWFGGEVSPMNTDVFHIYPTDIKVNSQRSNNPYGVCANGTRLTYGSYVAKGKLGSSTYPGYSGTVFEPDDEYKGDLARTYFYMVTCYKNELPSWPGSPNLNYGQNKYKAFSTWTINMLMEWSRLDPVSEKEIKRNDAVYGIQGNRNPFIDHPELAEYIWGNQQGNRWTGSLQPVDPAIIAPENGSVIDMGSTTVGKPIEYTISVKGEGLTSGMTITMEGNEYFYVDRNSFSASEVNNGTTFTIGFTADDEGTFTDIVTLSSSEVTSTFTITATAKPEDTPPPPPVVPTDSIVEDWEGCETGGYWTDVVTGNAFLWEFTDAGIWGDNLKHGELCCRMGKSSNSMIAMGEDIDGGSTSAIAFWAGSFGSDADATLSTEYSTDKGLSWNTLGDFTFTKGFLQHVILDIQVEGTLRFRIVQKSGSRVNIDDITIYGRADEGIKGDVNDDKEVNVADINVIIDTILGGNSNPKCDVNDDSEINIADVNTVIDIILGS